MARARLPGRWPLGKAACKFLLHSGEKPLRMAAAERKSEQVTQEGSLSEAWPRTWRPAAPRLAN